MQIQSLYQEIILDHYRNPHHKGLREPYDAEVHHVNPTCGDEVTLRVALKDSEDGPVVTDVSYDEQVLEDAVAFAGVSKYPARIKCALLGWKAWEAATSQAIDKEGQAS